MFLLLSSTIFFSICEIRHRFNQKNRYIFIGLPTLPLTALCIRQTLVFGRRQMRQADADGRRRRSYNIRQIQTLKSRPEKTDFASLGFENDFPTPWIPHHLRKPCLPSKHDALKHCIGLMLAHCLRRWPNIKPTVFRWALEKPAPVFPQGCLSVQDSSIV